MADQPSQPMRAWITHHPCFYLFLVLIMLILLLPAFDHSAAGQLWFSTANLLVLVTSLVTLGRSRFTLWVALLLVGPALVLLGLSHATGDAGYRVWSWRFSVAVLVAALVPLLRYVLGPEVMTIDKLFGGAAAYLLLGLLWCYLYALVEHLSPGSFDGLPSGSPHVADMVFFSFGTITTGGLADIVPRGKMAHALVILEELTGTLFMAVVVARLVASYPRQGATS
jgi:Ion channel